MKLDDLPRNFGDVKDRTLTPVAERIIECSRKIVPALGFGLSPGDIALLRGRRTL